MNFLDVNHKEIPPDAHDIFYSSDLHKTTSGKTLSKSENFCYRISAWHQVLDENEALCATMYKTVDKKIKPQAVPLPVDAQERIIRASKEPPLRNRASIGHSFTPATKKLLQVNPDGLLTMTEELYFRSTLEQRGKAFSFAANKIGCVDPSVVPPLIHFTVPHTPWDYKPIPIPRAHHDQLLTLLQDRIRMKVVVPRASPYANRWFTVPKKNNTLRFIQDLQPVNAVTIRSCAIGPPPDTFSEDFAGCSIYSMGDLFSGYDQFQLAQESVDITAMQTPLGQLAMTTVPQGGTNSVAHIVNGMHHVLRDFIPSITFPFIDDLPIRGCKTSEQDDTIDLHGCRRFVADHIRDVCAILDRMIAVGLTMSGEKTSFGCANLQAVGYICTRTGRYPNPKQLSKLGNMEACRSTTEVRRFLGALGIYRQWIPHFGHIAAPLYSLLSKTSTFIWTSAHDSAMRSLLSAITSDSVLVPLQYSLTSPPIILTVDTSPIAVGWCLSQEHNSVRRPARFGARLLHTPQKNYSQLKKELWGMMMALKHELIYLRGANVIIETDCLPLLGVIRTCSHADPHILRWITFVRTFAPVLRHISGVNNTVADMLSRASYSPDLPIPDPPIQISDDSHNFSDAENITALTSYISSTASSVLLSGVTSSAVSSAVFIKDKYVDNPHLQQIGLYLELLNDENNTNDDRLFRFSIALRKQAHNFFLQDGYLFRKGSPPRRTIGTQEERRSILNEHHDTHWGGHKGEANTYLKIKDRYWWPRMSIDVKRYVSTCEVCQFYSKQKNVDALTSSIPGGLHSRWVLDLVTMPRSSENYRYIVIAREDLSNYVEARALRTKTTSNVCSFILYEIISRYGAIGELRADNGELNAEEARTFFDRLKIPLKLTTTYNPEANGKSERGHQPLIAALAKACDGDLKQWGKLLPFALWADRMSVSRTTGYSPSKMMFGAQLPTPQDLSYVTWFLPQWRDNARREDLIAWRMQQLQHKDLLLLNAQEKLRISREKSVFDANAKRNIRSVIIKPGDWVLVWKSQLDTQHESSTKFVEKWTGPYVVIDVDDFHTYRLRTLDNVELARRVAGKRIKLFKQRE